MAAYAALVSLINNMEQITIHPRVSKCFDEEQIQSLLQKAGSLLDFIEQAHNHEDLEREITSAAHAAEDVIESHIVDRILAVADEETTNVLSKVLECAIGLARAIHRNCAGTVNLEMEEKEESSIDLQQLIQDMGAVAERAMKVKEREGVREEVEEEQPPPTHSTPHVESGGTAMVGLDDELTQLLDSLTDHHSNRHVVSIVGMGGTGKTTLAQNLYAHQLVKEHFDILAWATVSQQYTLQDILSQLISCIGKSSNAGGLGEKLHKTLYGRRYLIVLDDIWGVEAWDEVRRYLPDGGDRSRVVLTTRLSNVATLCGSAYLNLNLLDEEKSWKLFCEKSLFPNKDNTLQLEDVAKRIVQSCKGLALSIVVIGGLFLKSPRTVGYWEDVLKGLRTNNSKEKQQGLDALSTSYNHLPPHLKPCFLYIGVFIEDSRIRVSNITKHWVAEGFIKPKGSRVLEEIAEDYLKDLRDRNLVLGVELRHTGKIKSFSIHGLLRDLCVRVAEQEEFFHVRKYGEIQGTERRLVCDQFERKLENALARSILRKNISLEHDNCKLLRVLDATGSRVIKSPAYLFKHANLRYLAYQLPPSTGAVAELQTSVCLLWNLQTLIIGDRLSSQVAVAPVGIWKMRQLRHVECHQVHFPDPPPRDGQDKMENLHTLKRAVNLRLSEETCEIIPNIKKLHLVYDPKMQGYDDSLIECLRNLDRFHKLESLNMEIRASNPKLAFPLSLNKLCLSECALNWEDLSRTIGPLPQLQVLHLKTHAVMAGKMWSPVSGQFLRLKLLKIEKCSLCTWGAESSHFPVLEKLVLRELLFLEEIPLEIGEIPTLGLIRVEGCSESAAVSAVEIKRDQLENHDNDALRIEVVVYDWDLESFNMRLEEKELALNLLKLETPF